jgi:hypothetical protein
MLSQIDLSRADLNLLLLFAVVLEERHVGGAAERLSLSASAVSHGLGRLRRLLNDPLFLRTPKSRRDDICAIVTTAAMRDAGVAWLFGLLRDALAASTNVRRQRRRAG